MKPFAATDQTLVAPDSHAVLAATIAGDDGTLVSQSLNGTIAVSRTTVLPRSTSESGTPVLAFETRDRYVTEKVLGEGGVGEVVRALDQDIARPVAIKRIRAAVKSPSTLLRFVEEIRTIGQLEHANIVPIHDVGVDEKGDYYFVMKCVEGETLEHVIERLAAGDPLYHARYTFEHRVRIFVGILEAIAHAHQRGFVHRDIKPANVMVGPHGQVTVMDWGLAKRRGTPDTAAMVALHEVDGGRLHQTAVGSILGTPAYMSPEQARGEEATEQSDIYALCVLFYEFLTLRHPLEDCTTLEAMLDGVQHREPMMAGRVPSQWQRPVPMDLAWYLKAGLAKNPAERFVSVEAMLERLALRAEGIVPIQCHMTFAKRVTGIVNRTLDRYPMQVSIAMAVSVVTSVGSAVWIAAHAL